MNTFVPFAGIFCPTHGPVDIDKDEYLKQMARPSIRWVCPRCRQVADFDGRRYDELHQINPEECP